MGASIDRTQDPAWAVVEEFDERLFELCRRDDYVGIYREIQKRLGDGWRAMETAPKDGTVILGWEDLSDAVVEIEWDRDWGRWVLSSTMWGDETRSAKPAAWMPRPCAPRS